MKNLNEIKSIISAAYRKITNPVTEPIGRVLAPYKAKWNDFIYPVTHSWDVYKSNNPGKSKIIYWSFNLVKWGFIFVIAIILMTLFGVFGKLPTADEIKSIETSDASEIYSSDGVMIGKYYTENRTTIKLDSISPYLITALLAIEDKRFFEHSGIDLWSWMRVFKGVATNTQSMGGGSTLSQQLAKNLYPRKNYKIPGLSIFINKVKENIISIKLENIYNKEELLTMYLNTVPFGGNRYGIQEAARYFYNKRPKELAPEQAATLIGMLKATTALDPTRNPKNSEKRRNLVLSQMLQNRDFRFESEEMTTISRMVNTGSISQEQYDKLILKPIAATSHDDIGNDDGLGTYFREYLRTKELPRILKNILKDDGSIYNIYTDGLKIYTSLDSRMQKHAENAVFKHMSYLQKEFEKHWKGYKEEKPWGDDRWIDEQVKRSERYFLLKEAGISNKDIDSIFRIPAPMKVFTWDKIPIERDTMMTPLDSVRYYFTLLNCGFMAMEHANGYVKAWVGGTDFKYFKYDHILSKRQVGSTFKPIVYAAALNDSISPCKYFKNSEVTIQDWSPKNSDEKYGGWYSVIGGLTYSANVIAAQLIEKVGIQKTIDLARKMGITSFLPREFGISLGAADISLYEMMKVYGTIANKGIRPEPVTVLKIEDRYGNEIYNYEEIISTDPKAGPNVRALDTLIAATMTKMMQSVVIYGTANNLRSQYCTHCDFAGKTGTTQNHSDGWLIAYNPKLVTGAWVGGPSPAVRFRTMGLGSGSAMALPIVGNFWYSLSIDPKSAKITQEKFPVNEQVNAKFGCPFRIGVSPDTLNMLMQDSTLRDSLTRNGFRNLRQIVNDIYGIPQEDVPTVDGEGEIIMENDSRLEIKTLDGKNAENIKSKDNKIPDKKNLAEPKEKPKEPPKKGNGGN
ncbi:MAG: transglycosylase domain-containing protein [Saprospiraceae bacterium]|jgi:penicillin-binding protein 1A|nr:transglycosylase domain-containing protein [Saprospiraceae bacterium]